MQISILNEDLVSNANLNVLYIDVLLHFLTVHHPHTLLVP